MNWRCFLAGLIAIVAGNAEAPPLQTPGHGFRRITLPEAKKLVAAWVKSHVKRPPNWHEKPSLVDVTTKEIEWRLGVQVFKLEDYAGSISEAAASLCGSARIFGEMGLEGFTVKL